MFFFFGSWRGNVVLDGGGKIDIGGVWGVCVLCGSRESRFCSTGFYLAAARYRPG